MEYLKQNMSMKIEIITEWSNQVQIKYRSNIGILITL